MIPAAEALRSVYAAARMARLDPAALALFDCSREGAVRSFFAAALLAPVFAVMIVVDAVQDPPGGGALRVFLVESLTYLMSWTAFLAIMSVLVGPLGRADRFFRLVVAYNWSAVIQVAVLVPVELINRFGILPSPLSELLVLVAGVAVLTYLWFVIKTALDVTGPLAALLVVMDLGLALSIIDWSESLVAG